jgi:hypothetical protein
MIAFGSRGGGCERFGVPDVGRLWGEEMVG